MLSKRTRDKLVLEHLPLVEIIASDLKRQLPLAIELAELVAEGTLGLLDAARKYDRTRKNRFDTYARFRIKGAIIDYLRRTDVLTRSERRKQRAGTLAPAGEVEVSRFIDLGDDELDILDRIQDTAEPADEHIYRREMAAMVDAAVASLPRRDRDIIWRIYWREYSLARTGCDLGLSEPRISQLHARILRHLRAEIKAKMHCG